MLFINSSLAFTSPRLPTYHNHILPFACLFFFPTSFSSPSVLPSNNFIPFFSISHFLSVPFFSPPLFLPFRWPIVLISPTSFLNLLFLIVLPSLVLPPRTPKSFYCYSACVSSLVFTCYITHALLSFIICHSKSYAISQHLLLIFLLLQCRKFSILLLLFIISYFVLSVISQQSPNFFFVPVLTFGQSVIHPFLHNLPFCFPISYNIHLFKFLRLS